MLRIVGRLTFPSPTVAALLATLAGAALAGCQPAAPPSACTSDACASVTFVVREFVFVKHPDVVGAPHVVEGFDLDDTVTTEEDHACGGADQTAPDGTPGIDNASATLFELVEAFVKDGVEGLIQTAINQGTLLMMVRVEGVDDLRDDDEVAVRILAGVGTPQLGTDGQITPNQTFAVDPTVVATVGRGRIVDGLLEAGPFEAVVPFSVAGFSDALRFHGCRVRGRLTSEGELLDAMIGGGVELEQIYAIAQAAGAIDANSATVLGLLPYVVDPMADLAPDEEGTCRRISAAIRIGTQPAYLIDDPFRRTP